MIPFAQMHHGLVGKEGVELVLSLQPYMKMGRRFWTLEIVINKE